MVAHFAAAQRGRATPVVAVDTTMSTESSARMAAAVSSPTHSPLKPLDVAVARAPATATAAITSPQVVSVRNHMLWAFANEEKKGLKAGKYFPYSRKDGSSGEALGPGIEISESKAREVESSGGLTPSQLNKFLDHVYAQRESRAASAVNKKAGRDAWGELTNGQKLIVIQALHQPRVTGADLGKVVAEAATGHAADTAQMLAAAQEATSSHDRTLGDASDTAQPRSVLAGIVERLDQGPAAVAESRAT